MDISKSSAPKLPDHELIRLDAAVHPERTPSEHEDAAREIAATSHRAATGRLRDLDMLDACYTGLELDGV